MGHACDKMGWVQRMVRHPPRKEDVIGTLMNMLRQPTTHLEKKLRGFPSKEPRDIALMLLEPPTNTARRAPTTTSFVAAENSPSP